MEKSKKRLYIQVLKGKDRNTEWVFSGEVIVGTTGAPEDNGAYRAAGLVWGHDLLPQAVSGGWGEMWFLHVVKVGPLMLLNTLPCTDGSIQ